MTLFFHSQGIPPVTHVGGAHILSARGVRGAAETGREAHTHTHMQADVASPGPGVRKAPNIRSSSVGRAAMSPGKDEKGRSSSVGRACASPSKDAAGFQQSIYHLYIRTHTYMYIYIYIYMHIYMHICTNTYMYISILRARTQQVSNNLLCAGAYTNV